VADFEQQYLTPPRDMQMLQGVVDVILTIGNGPCGEVFLKGKMGEGIGTRLARYQQAGTIFNHLQEQGRAAVRRIYVVTKIHKLAGNFSL